MPLEPRVTADQTGELPGVWLTYNAVKPDRIVPSDPTRRELLLGRTGRVGQSVVYVTRSTDDGAPGAPRRGRGRPQGTSSSRTSTPSPASWASSGRTTGDPTYDVQYPIGNTR